MILEIMIKTPGFLEVFLWALIISFFKLIKTKILIQFILHQKILNMSFLKRKDKPTINYNKKRKIK
jgi:hypothetical protein